MCSLRFLAVSCSFYFPVSFLFWLIQMIFSFFYFYFVVLTPCFSLFSRSVATVGRFSVPLLSVSFPITDEGLVLFSHEFSSLCFFSLPLFFLVISAQLFFLWYVFGVFFCFPSFTPLVLLLAPFCLTIDFLSFRHLVFFPF